MPTLFAKQTLREGLPRTWATLAASNGLITGTKAGLSFGTLLAAFALDDPSTNINYAFAGAAATAVLSGVVSAIASYGISYGAANLTLVAFPSIQEKRLPLLAPGKKSQLLFFAGVAAAEVAALAANASNSSVAKP